MTFSKLKKKILRIGIDPTLDALEQKRVKIITIIILICIPILILFTVINFFNDQKYLALFYVVMTGLVAIIFYGNAKKKGERFRMVMICLISVTCAAGSIIFGNGQEYYVLLISFLSLLFYDLRKDVLYLSILYIIFFIGCKIYEIYWHSPEQASSYIKIVNLFLTVGILSYFLYDIKKTYLRVLQEAEMEQERLRYVNALLQKQAAALEMNNKYIDELTNKNDELSTLIYHQMRSPLASFSNILNEFVDYSSYPKEEFIKMTKLTQVKVAETLDTIDKLLTWNTKGSEKINPSFEKVDIDSKIGLTIDLFQPVLKKKNIRINYTAKDRPLIAADSTHVQIILQNLIANAIKFSPEGEEVIIILSREGKDSCSTLISNRGEQISKEKLATILSSSEQFSKLGTMNERGSGMGLKICQYLIEKNNGSFKIMSAGSGITTAYVDLEIWNESY